MKFRTEVERHSKAHCKGVEPFVSMTRFNSIRGYFMIDNCPLSAEKSGFGSKCVNDSSLSDLERVPVFVDGSHVYKNRYCALCNDVSNFNTVNLTVHCKRREMVVPPSMQSIPFVITPTTPLKTQSPQPPLKVSTTTSTTKLSEKKVHFAIEEFSGCFV